MASTTLWLKPIQEWPAKGSVAKPTEDPKHIKVTLEDEKGISHLQLARAPVNSLSFAMMREVNEWLLWLGSNEETKALVISSAFPGIFSAGLDIAELVRPTPDAFSAFWQELQRVWLLLNTFPKPVVSAVNGSSPAGGCVIALASDARVMARQRAGTDAGARQFTIGLNETKLGIVAPPWAAKAYSYVLGSRVAERLLQMGDTPTAEEALKIGLVDSVTSDEASCVEAAFKEAEKLLTVPAEARRLSRDNARHHYLMELGTPEARAADVAAMSALTLAEPVQVEIETYIARLRDRSKK